MSYYKMCESGFFSAGAGKKCAASLILWKKNITFVKIWNRMPQTDFHEQLRRIVDKTRLLLIRNQALAEEVKRLKSEAADRKAELLARDSEIEKLRLELEYLKVASTVSPTADDRRHAAEMISNLVREIDRCIADLQG